MKSKYQSIDPNYSEELETPSLNNEFYNCKSSTEKNKNLSSNLYVFFVMICIALIGSFIFYSSREFVLGSFDYLRSILDCYCFPPLPEVVGRCGLFRFPPLTCLRPPINSFLISQIAELIYFCIYSFCFSSRSATRSTLLTQNSTSIG